MLKITREIWYIAGESNVSLLTIVVIPYYVLLLLHMSLLMLCCICCYSVSADVTCAAAFVG